MLVPSDKPVSFNYRVYFVFMTVSQELAFHSEIKWSDPEDLTDLWHIVHKLDSH